MYYGTEVWVCISIIMLVNPKKMGKLICFEALAMCHVA